MDYGLTGKRAFVSGSTQGIGYAVARTCAAEGASVVLNGRDAHRVDRAVDRLRAELPDADVSGIAADFADGREVQALLDALGRVDVLVNNVGLFGVEPFIDTGDDTWRRYFEVNVMSGVRLSRRLLPAMLAAGWGRIVFVGTESAVDVPGDMVHYGATKAAVMALSNGLAKLTRGTGVTVNTVLGGPTYSEGVADTVERIAALRGTSPDELKAALVRDTSLLQRFIEPDEVAHLVAYLASPVSSATNGAALRADGGVLTTLV
ncbi:SDR family NAD(P)-dependent oxidoreductase [Microbacterium marinilacus]|uniref:SDR family oxidoreductase n=1 Tax=Microbacterium marinilacus TaxID=415209 RepID=A0ABP7B1Y2_9MICO|nr:SDR family oxidoreductase [Microbacterium marinilacus]MBY0688606.1 SDR family oxidoreductase [Microbacterium marinilacus]